jgi:cytochrome P450
MWKIILGQKHTSAQRLHEKYGEVVRVKPNELSFISETASKDIYGFKQVSGAEIVRKYVPLVLIYRQGRTQMQKWARVPLGTKAFSILNAPDDVHARQRKVFAHAFSAQAVRDIVPSSRALLILNS